MSLRISTYNGLGGCLCDRKGGNVWEGLSHLISCEPVLPDVRVVGYGWLEYLVMNRSYLNVE